MPKKSIFLLTILFSLTVNAASFDCKKASTRHEKLICGNSELSAADADMGEIYRTAMKSFPIKGFIEAYQREWLISYRLCGDVTKCINEVRERTSELKNFVSSTVYTDSNEKKFYADAGMLIFYRQDSKQFVRLFGNWMPDGTMDPEKMKGYPHDGFICNENLELTVSNKKLINKEDPTVVFQLNQNSVEMKGHVPCNARTGFGEGTYKKITPSN